MTWVDDHYAIAQDGWSGNFKLLQPPHLDRQQSGVLSSPN
jgi:hypothetical protein